MYTSCYFSREQGPPRKKDVFEKERKVLRSPPFESKSLNEQGILFGKFSCRDKKDENKSGFSSPPVRWGL